ncbi:MAG: hypothetical protein LUM44_13745 [Pyrinomonadaceae bacterium]|nr:hypothetical protein [Pyrinomonadaceae bacterium]
MWTKIYLIALAIAIIPTVLLTYYSYSWLKSIGAPLDSAANFEYFSNISVNYLWISTLILLILGNILLWKTRKSWALWATLGYFSVFVIAKYFWLDVAFSQFRQIKGLPETGIAVGVFMGVFYCLFFAIIIFFDQFIVLRMNGKMYPQLTTPSAPENELAEESAPPTGNE